MLCNNSHTKALGSLAWTRRLVVSHHRKALEEDLHLRGAATFLVVHAEPREVRSRSS